MSFWLCVWLRPFFYFFIVKNFANVFTWSHFGHKFLISWQEVFEMVMLQKFLIWFVLTSQRCILVTLCIGCFVFCSPCVLILKSLWAPWGCICTLWGNHNNLEWRTTRFAMNVTILSWRQNAMICVHSFVPTDKVSYLHIGEHHRDFSIGGAGTSSVHKLFIERGVCYLPYQSFKYGKKILSKQQKSCVRMSSELNSHFDF